MCRQYYMADILGSARESFSDYGELAALESWERSQLERIGVDQLIEGIAVTAPETGLQLVVGKSIAKANPVEIPAPPVVALKAASLLRR
jgi:hypothetical protein